MDRRKGLCDRVAAWDKALANDRTLGISAATVVEIGCWGDDCRETTWCGLCWVCGKLGPSHF